MINKTASDSIVIDVLIEAEAWAELDGMQELSEQAIRATLALTRFKIRKGAELSILLTDDAHIRRLNCEWRNQDKATNVLSFPAARVQTLATSQILGDIILAYETIKAEAMIEGKTLANHVKHLLVHGFLHILGYDHQNAKEAERMEALEIAILAHLNVANPYANSDLLPGPAQDI